MKVGDAVEAPRGGEQTIVAEVGTYKGKKFVLLTHDGYRIKPEWHSGPESGIAVYYEYVGPSALRGLHGWVDSTSRKIVQTG